MGIASPPNGDRLSERQPFIEVHLSVPVVESFDMVRSAELEGKPRYEASFSVEKPFPVTVTVRSEDGPGLLAHCEEVASSGWIEGTGMLEVDQQDWHTNLIVRTDLRSADAD